MNYNKWLDDATKKLRSAGIESARLDSQLLLMHASGKSKEWILAHSHEEVGESIVTAADDLLGKRASRTPLAYITGKRQFYGRDFIVSEMVLVPRPESEVIIELFSELVLQKKIPVDSQVFDIGTGSGCLAVTLKAEFPEFKVCALDISEAALKVAKVNAKTLGANVTFIESDLLENLEASTKDCLVANLPYVPDSLITSDEILAEPKLALFAGEDGLDAYRKFWHQVATLRIKPLFIITESLQTKQEAMVELASKAGYAAIRTKDLIQVFTLI